MKKQAIIGIDTSNYTTSVAVLDIDGNLISNRRKLLPVAEGACGLRQSDAVFSHLKNIPEQMQSVSSDLCDCVPVAIGVSARPRNQDGSYMPCFLSGISVAEGMAVATSAPLYKFSHQCGHIMAAAYSCGRTDIIKSQFAAFHVSGGTTELLKVSLNESNIGFDAELIGKTLDLNAGQVIDRIGVTLGLKFPCGGELEKLACAYQGKILKRKPSVKGFNISLSGLENMAKKLYAETNDVCATAAFVFEYVADAIIAMTDAYIEEYGNMPILYAGGVMRNTMIRKKLSQKFDAYFAEPDMSSDNAVGIAELARLAYIKR